MSTTHGWEEHQTNHRYRHQSLLRIGRPNYSSRWLSFGMRTCVYRTMSLTYVSVPCSEEDLGHLPTTLTRIVIRSHDHPDGCRQVTDQLETGTLTNPRLPISKANNDEVA